MISVKESDATPLSLIVDYSTPNVLTKKEATALNRCQQLSLSSYVVMNDDKLLCVWGIIAPSILSIEAYLWLHVTPNIEGNQFMFIRRSQIMLDNLLKEYHAVVGHVKSDAKSSKKWLKFLGAQFTHSGGPLISFRIERNG